MPREPVAFFVRQDISRIRRRNKILILRIKLLWGEPSYVPILMEFPTLPGQVTSSIKPINLVSEQSVGNFISSAQHYV